MELNMVQMLSNNTGMVDTRENNAGFEIKNNVKQKELQDFKKEVLAVSPKLERIPSKDMVSFKGNNSEVKNDNITAKKIGVGIASAIIPGAGQAINDDWKKAIGFLAGGIGATTACGLLWPLLLATNPLALLVLPVVPIAVDIWSIVDAAKNVK